MFPALQFTQAVPNHFTGVVIGTGFHLIVHKLGEMGRQGDVTAMSGRHVSSSSRLSDEKMLAEGVKV